MSGSLSPKLTSDTMEKMKQGSVIPGGLSRVFSALAEESVHYAVFGAIALAIHGLPRATADLDLFIEPSVENVGRLKRALRRIWDDPNIEDISAEDLCGEYPALRYYPPTGFFLDIVTRLGEAFSWSSLEIEERRYEGIRVQLVSARTLWRMKRDTIRPADRFDAALLAEHFGFGGE